MIVLFLRILIYWSADFGWNIQYNCVYKIQFPNFNLAEAAAPLPWVCPWPWQIYLGCFTKVESHKRPWSALKCQSCINGCSRGNHPMNHFNCSYQPHDYSVNIPLDAYCSDLLLCVPTHAGSQILKLTCIVQWLRTPISPSPVGAPHTSRMNRSRPQKCSFFSIWDEWRSRNQVILSVKYHCHNCPAVKLNQPVTHCTVYKTKVV